MTRRALGRRVGMAAAGLVAGRALRGGSEAAAAEEERWCSLGAAEPVASIDAPSSLGGPPEVVGSWSAPIQSPTGVIAVHAVLLHTGHVLFLEGGDAVMWSPADGSRVRTDPPKDLFCSGHCMLGDGRVFFAGGAKTGPPPNWTTLFDPVTATWASGPPMRQGRWYPTVTTMPAGDQVVIVSGEIDRSGVVNDDVEVYSAADASLTAVGSRRLGLYPHQKVMPDGRVLTAGPGPDDSWSLDPEDWSWSASPRLLRSHHNGGGVLLPGGPGGPHELLLCGSTYPSGAMVEAFDVDRPEDGWRRRAPLPEPRAHMNAVLLPDGTILGVAGSNADGNLHRSLLYDPAGDAWTPMATQTKVRGYHSTALLLPDGRVLSAGDNIDPGGLDTFELYSPPYLFRGPRPSIVAAPPVVTWGEVFEVRATASVARVVLVRPGSVTHTNNMEQRHVELVLEGTGVVVRASAPPSPAVAPAGYYLVFVLDAAGVPSVASWVRLA
ncbi:MAG TPA: galactose oxidase early set domain-containing protein [Acidimicrobiales bacterium]|jgi:hypothetical protein